LKKILVTGASGYIAKHCLAELIKEGYSVKGTARDRSKGAAVKVDLENHLNQDIDIEFVETTLNDDRGWDEAVEGCDAIMHVASPFPRKYIENEDDLIIPAKEGTIHVLNAAKNAGVERVIITSSNAAISYGHKGIDVFDESCWTNIDAESVTAYTKSKTIAEKSAWDFVSKNPEIKLTTINPVLVWGPGIGNHLHSSSLAIYKMLFKKEQPMVPKIIIPIVDVRDVAKMHVSALKTDNSIGKRFLLSENTYWMKDISQCLKDLGYNAPTMEAPDFLIKLMAKFDKSLVAALPHLGFRFTLNTNQAKKILGFNPIPLKDTCRDTADYLSDLL
jgi:dihydroflavonol-4-reductase